ncbi:zinc finger protein 142 [Parambassis ranga]|uniref:Zinc finger protein 142 n=1 Tax=Parambassis ranga TaxID=210632 RepID=A0A6P7HCP2_9TELE|nr:zinc finger protein 142 [Parambassis ranga]XP_028249512.1 zinc finger protein 142 [Parambassis ranga]
MEIPDYGCEKCGKSFSDSSMFVFHPCSNRQTSPSSKGQLVSYKCSRCSEVFSKPAALKHHFKNSHSEHELKRLFSCSEQGCQFSSADRQEYQTHLMSSHGLTLIPCKYRLCKVSCLTHEEMESHWTGHMPFGCSYCQFVTHNAQDLAAHLMEHNHLPNYAPGNDPEPLSICTPGSHLPQVKKRKSNPACEPSTSSQNGHEEKPESEGNNMKRARKAVEKDTPSAEDPEPVPSKEYLAEGSEHIYRTHICPKCRRCFKMRSHLQEHLHLHFPNPSLQCPTCKRYFTSKSKLRVHRLREAGEKIHHCHLCDYSAVERNAIRRHLSSMHADESQDGINNHSYLCPTCGERFRQSRVLKAHMKTHNIQLDNQPLACFQESCPFQSSLGKDLIRHAAEVHRIKAVECRHHACGAVFQSKREMEDHYRTHLAYHCSECDFSCSNKTVFLQHQRLGHPGNEKLCCDFCCFITFNPVEFEQHIGHLHANEKIHSCSQCSYVTSHKRGLKRHMLMHSGEKPHKCSLCDFRCRDESYLSKHMLTHSDDKNFMCAECGYVTKWKHYLNVHMRKHAGDLRYACDQCPYRCHRMDQLNSHKLRHQDKSLMCEICAYACKRKYELRNHMLAKHSGQEKPAAVYKCKYCTYTTSYRQALQNHENCKHTKLKEFRCALCFYASFSSISLFLHKRKAHGYVPGDKAWLENYAAKEKERKSTEIMQDFYIKPSVDEEQICEGLPASIPPLPDLADHSSSKETAAASQLVDCVDALDVASQEIVDEGLSNPPPSINSPEEYCTLVLTTLSATDYQTPSLTNEQEKDATTFNCNKLPEMSQENASISTSSSSEDDAGMPECEQSDLDNTIIPETSEVENNSTYSVEQNQEVQSEVHLKAMKKHDKDQAEAMVLEGRVQMLVVPTKEVYHCDKCSYVTSKETALKHHSQAVCYSRTTGHVCQACGAHFKQRRGLDNHLKKQCPTLPRKTRTFVRNLKDSTVGQEGSKHMDGGTWCDQMEHLVSRHEISSDPEFHQQEKDVCSSNQQSRTQTDIMLVKKTDKSDNQEKNYNKKDGKFKCKLCSFSSVKLPTVQRHLSTCRKLFKEKKNQVMSGADEEDGNGSVQNKVQEEQDDEHPAEFSKKAQIFGCPSCAFKCSQKRALDSHKKKGCMKAGEVQCTLCSFVAKSKMSLTHHVLYVHNKKTFGAAKHLHCQHCTFSCKQQRRMARHVALKHKGTQPHRCRFCPFSTTRRYRLEEHESLHTGVGRHSCDICDKTFGAVTKLRQHKTRIHDKQPTHFCSLCDFSGYTLDDVRRHKLRCHTGELQHICTHCDAQFSSEVALRNHCKRVHQLQTCFSCKQCDYTCSSDVTLKSHQLSKHSQVKCTTCQESFETKESLEIHQRCHMAHQCQLCPFATRTKPLLAQHLLSQHEKGAPEDKPLKCSICEFACCHQLVLEQHLRSHGSKRLYKCTDCKYSTRNKQKITWHIRIHTGEKPYSCEQCSYTCTDPSRLKLHMRVHQVEKKYLCPECGYKCKWATQLKYHMTKHTGEKPYACDECDYRTNRADALRAHRDTQHCDLRPYVCEKCGKAFKTSFILKTHQRQHSDDRPYTCGLCQKAFRWPAGLRHHYLSHTKQQPFSCRHCSYRAKQKFQVVKHLQRHHPEVSVEHGVVRDSDAGSLTLKEALQGSLDQTTVEEAANELLPLVTEVEEVAEEVLRQNSEDTE